MTQTQTTSRLLVKFTGQHAYRWDATARRWVRIPLDIARLGVNEGRMNEWLAR